MPTFDNKLYIKLSKDLHLMTVEELEEELEAAEDKLTERLKKEHARWGEIPITARAKKLVSLSAALAWLDLQNGFEQGTIVSSAIDCTLYHGNEAVQTPSESPKELKYPAHGVPDDSGKTLSPIVVESSELVDDEQEEEKENERPVEDGNQGADTIVATLCLTLRRSVIRYQSDQD